MKTYQTLYKNEKRAVEITINDQDGRPFLSDAASASVYDKNNVVIVAEQAATVSENTVYTIIDSTTTEIVGNYKIIWKLKKDNYKYQHVTDLIIEDL